MVASIGKQASSVLLQGKGKINTGYTVMTSPDLLEWESIDSGWFDEFGDTSKEVPVDPEDGKRFYFFRPHY